MSLEREGRIRGTTSDADIPIPVPRTRSGGRGTREPADAPRRAADAAHADRRADRRRKSRPAGTRPGTRSAKTSPTPGDRVGYAP
ncbi:hypothetical protein DDQ41_03905 [Streptomyces spongiicola]|uniref:Uncharacterized protein n=1 Tax=Streptomyces spongiicola TaxID=1690221 RepID=A0ABM6V3J2_9ACTN|nr:hypothetical protein DDQ41_03905 [Streptomyces spongiicola]